MIGKIDSVQSKILNEKRKIWVHIPDSGPAGFYAKQRYLVVYLLVGNAHFSSVVGIIEQLSSVNGNMICPEMIVVAIPSTNRTRDLTPTHVESCQERGTKCVCSGQPDNKLVPIKPNEFTIRNAKGYLLQFEINGDKTTGFNATTPNGQFKAMTKK